MSLTPFQRTQSWNVEVVFEQSWRVFGFRQHGNNPLHISQIAHDFDLCFSTNKSGDDAASWQPAFLRTSNTDKILIVLDRQDNRVFPIPDAGSIHCYELVLHYDCARPGDQHSLEDDCIHYEREIMQRRFDPRYYSIGAKSTDYRLISFPTRSSSQTRGLFETRTSSLKRDSTNSSPTKSPSPSRTDATCTDYATAISSPDARRTIAMFADSS
ncbi:hypothetical protein VM1G_08680 [Cytospora mali]|uniref:Uncharacterized protein n=1 Tax=Cytospora mali TaxID=578113 RepID=A0A194WAQ7_CYTMA|nr:hypothetical protein VM1G_08680 [Valsa mali]